MSHGAMHVLARIPPGVATGIVHFAGAIHSATAGALPTMATLPPSCPPPPAAIIVQVPAYVNNSIQATRT